MSADFPAIPVTGLVSGNRLQLLESGGEYFPALIAAIAAAVHEVHLESYIFADDTTGRMVAASLARAAQRGVAVRVLVDGFGSREFAAGLGAALDAGGVEVMTYRPEAGQARIRRHRLRRMHRKLAVIDGQVAFVGGINVIDDFDGGRSAAARFDYAVRLEGPLVAEVHAAMRHVWRLVRWARLGRRPPPPAQLTVEANCFAGNVLAALLIRDNLRHRRDIEHAYLAAIGSARQEVLISNAYFLPGRRFLGALKDAARRGVRVMLLLQGRTDHVLLHFATQSLYDRLLSSGVRIFEYRDAYLHAKVAVIDGGWATVGSSNIDPFSFLLAREANVVVCDSSFGGQLKASLEAAIDRSATEIRPEDLHRRSWLVRLTSRAAYAVVRILIGVTRYAGSEYRP